MAVDPVNADAEVPGMKEAKATFTSAFWKPVEQRPGNFLQQAAAKIKKYLAGPAPANQPPPGTRVTAQDIEAFDAAAKLSPILLKNQAVDILSSIPEGRELLSSLTPDQTLDVVKGRRSQNLASVEFSPRGVNFTSEGIVIEQCPLPGVVALMAHELQHAKQVNAGVLDALSDKIPSPVERLWYTRAIEADATATQVDIAWKLKAAGHPEVWEAQVHDSPLMTKAYEDQVKANPAAATDGRAKRAAFDGWFQDTNRRGIKNTQTYNAEGAEKVIPKEILEKLAAQGMPLKPMETADIKKLGALSDVNYLALPGTRPLDDMYYRQPDWNAIEAKFLSGRQAEYESVKTSLPAAPGDAEKPQRPRPERLPSPM